MIAPRSCFALFVLLSACAAAPDGDHLVACSTACPDGTRLATFESVVSGEGVVVTSAQCETYCEPVLLCMAPNVPVVSDDAYACKPLEGFASIPADADVDFSFALLWSSR